MGGVGAATSPQFAIGDNYRHALWLNGPASGDNFVRRRTLEAVATLTALFIATGTVAIVGRTAPRLDDLCDILVHPLNYGGRTVSVVGFPEHEIHFMYIKGYCYSERPVVNGMIVGLKVKRLGHLLNDLPYEKDRTIFVPTYFAQGRLRVIQSVSQGVVNHTSVVLEEGRIQPIGALDLSSQASFEDSLKRIRPNLAWR